MKCVRKVLGLVAVLVVASAAVFAQRLGGGEVKALIVEFQPGVAQVAGGPKTSSRLDELSFTNSEIATALRSAGCERISQAVFNYNPADTVVINPYGIPVRLPAFDRIFTFYFPKSTDVNRLQSQLQKMRGVVYAESVAPHLPTYDPLYQFQWGLQNNGQGGGVPGEDIGAERAWQTTTGSPNVRVGIIETGPNTNILGGVYCDHPDLSSRIFIRSAGIYSHGTHVAGIVGAVANNGIGVKGVDWQAMLGAFSLPKDGNPAGTAQVIINAARDNSCNVLNNSWSTGNAYYTVERQAFATAYMLDRVTVASMDNWGDNIPSYPAAYGQGIIAVGAMTNGGARAGYSCYGSHIDVIAPGGDEARGWLSDNIRNIKSTYYNGDTLYRYAGGTSMAAPFVSGIAALLKGYRPDLCNDDIEKIICYSARDKYPWGWDDRTGWGLARADQALDKLRPPWLLDQMEVAGGTVTNQTGRLAMTFYNVPGLEDGQLYWAYRYEVTSPFVNYPRVYDQVYSWTRGSATVGFHPGNPNFGMGWCEQVNMNNQGFALRTYVYDVWDLGYNHIGWFPSQLSQVRCRFTLLGIPTTPPPPNTPNFYSDGQVECIKSTYNPGCHWDDPEPTISDDYYIQRQYNWRPNGTWVPFIHTGDPVHSFRDEDRCYNLPWYPIGYRIQACNGGGCSDWSGALVFNFPPSGDPLIASSHDSLATAHPNGQKIILDRKDRLHMVFTSQDTVYYSNSNKKAKRWSSPVAVGLGRFPAISMDSQGDPYVLWVSGTQVLSSHLSGGVWAVPYIMYNQPFAQTIEAPSFVINTANDSGFASWTVVTTTSSEVSLASFMPGDTTAPVSIQRVDSGGATSFASPSLALDPTGKVLLAWSRDGVVYFQEQGGSVINLSQSPGRMAIHPVVDAFGDRIAVTWQEQDLTGRFRIYQAFKEDGFWKDKMALSPSSGNSLFPSAVGASQIAFSSDMDNNRHINYCGTYEDGGIILSNILSFSSGVGPHNYPSIALDNDWPDANLHCVWTAIGPDPLPIIKSISIVVPPVPSVFVDAGKAAPSSYTVQRAGTVSYGSQPYLTADTHPQMLIYRFSGLDRNKRYRLGATYYFEKLGETWRMRLKVDGRDGMRTRIPSGERVDDSNWVPTSVYQDGVIDVEISPDAGDFALCNEIALYEFDRGSGGPQTDEAGPIVELPLTYALSQSFPNPFKDKATIAYQLPEEVSVSLKVFNVTGQVVRELASGKQKAGYYNAVWDGKDGSGRSVSSGVYFYRLDAGGFSKTNKLVVVR